MITRPINEPGNESPLVAQPEVSTAISVAEAAVNPSINVRTDGMLDRRVQVLLHLIERHSHRPLAVRELAVVVNLSPGRLAHLFKHETGISLQQYLTQIRVSKAKHKLDSTFLSIKEIASEVGFSSVARFSCSFRTINGATPSQYRKQPRPDRF